MMYTPNRRWYTVGHELPVLVLIDFSLGFPIAWIQSEASDNISDNEPREAWQPELEDSKFSFLAVAGSNEKRFSYQLEDPESARLAMAHAITWVENILPPPVTKMPRWKLYLKALKFWKYDYMWYNGEWVGLIVKGSELQNE